MCGSPFCPRYARRKRRAQDCDPFENMCVYALFSSEEEVGLRGAATGAFALSPDEAVVVDVTHGDTRNVPEYLTKKLSSGAAIGISPSLNRRTSKVLRRIAEEKEIPYTLEVMTGATGTNASSICIAGAGVDCALLSIPLRYMHTPCEVISMEDIKAVSELLCEYALYVSKKGKGEAYWISFYRKSAFFPAFRGMRGGLQTSFKSRSPRFQTVYGKIKRETSALYKRGQSPRIKRSPFSRVWTKRALWSRISMKTGFYVFTA